MPAIYEILAKYDCKRHGEEDYVLAEKFVDRIRGKNKYSDIQTKKENEKNRRVIQMSAFRRARDRQSVFIRKIKDALKCGDITHARHLAMEGAQRYKKRYELQEYARLLAPPRIIDNNVPANSSIRANHIWLKAHRQQYQGNWVALRSGELIGVADSLEILVKDIGYTKNVLLTKA